MAISWDKNNHSQKQFQKKSYRGGGCSRVSHPRSQTIKNFFQKKGSPYMEPPLQKGMEGCYFFLLA